MSDASLWAGYFKEDSYQSLDYDELITKGLGKRILFSRDFGDYQGDSMYLMGSWDSPEFLVVGWGSCSGCDALQAAESAEDVAALVNSFERDTRQFTSFEEFESWFTHPDRDQEFWWAHEEGRQQFLKDAKEHRNV